MRLPSPTIPNLIVVTKQTEKSKHSELNQRVRNIAHHASRLNNATDSCRKTFHKIGNHVMENRNVTGYSCNVGIVSSIAKIIEWNTIWNHKGTLHGYFWAIRLETILSYHRSNRETADSIQSSREKLLCERVNLQAVEKGQFLEKHHGQDVHSNNNDKKSERNHNIPKIEQT